MVWSRKKWGLGVFTRASTLTLTLTLPCRQFGSFSMVMSIEGVDVVEFSGVDQAHEHIADVGSTLALEVERVLAMQDHALEHSLTEVVVEGAPGIWRKRVSLSQWRCMYLMALPRDELGSTRLSPNCALSQVSSSVMRGALCSWWKRRRSSGDSFFSSASVSYPALRSTYIPRNSTGRFAGTALFTVSQALGAETPQSRRD